MATSGSDKIISRYDLEVSLDRDTLNELKTALLEPQSKELKTILRRMIDVQASELGKITDAIPLRARAMEREPHLFLSEALERSVVASSLCRRLRGTKLDSRVFHMIWQVCELCASVYTVVPGRFSSDDMDRLLRTRTLGAEDGGASTIFGKAAQYIADASFVEANVNDQPERAALYANLIERLERAESATRENTERSRAANSIPLKSARKQAVLEARKARRHFKEEDYEILAQMRNAVGRTVTGPAQRAKTQRDQEAAGRRKKVVEGISIVWRDTFVYLLDLIGIGERELVALKDDPKVAHLACLDELERGSILVDLANLRTEFPDYRNGRANRHRLDSISRRSARQGADTVDFRAWKRLIVVADLVLEKAARLGDADMALVIRAAQNWRPFCKFELLDSAQKTLEAAPAPLTLSALRSLAERPSHAILPGNAGPNFDGDVWLNGAPPRARELVSRFQRPHTML